MKSFISEYSVSIKYSDSLLNLILSIIKSNADACRLMRSIEDGLEHIEKFCQKNPIPKAYSSRQELFRRISNDAVEKKLSEDDKNLLTSYAEHRLQVFKDLLIDIDYEEHIKNFATIDENTLSEMQSKSGSRIIMHEKGDQIDYHKEEYKFWIEATVVEDYGPIILVNYKIPQIIVKVTKCNERKNWVKINKDSVRAEGLYTNHMLYQINGIYEFLYMKALENEKSSYGSSRYSRYN